MKAGRELDARIAEDVFGRDIRKIEFASKYELPIYRYEGTDINSGDSKIPHYSTQIADAWPVVEKLKEKWGSIDIRGDGDNEWVVGWNCDGMFFLDDTFAGAVYAPTAPLAICLAALAVVERRE